MPGERELLRDLEDNYRREKQAAALYDYLAKNERDAARRRIFEKMAAAEEHHAERWAERIAAAGGQAPADCMGWQARMRIKLARWLGADAAIRRQEAAEDRDIATYERQRARHPADIGEILDEVQRDERKHTRYLQALDQAPAPQDVLQAIFGRERWHRRGHHWIGDAIYGANDGLGAVFGLVSGVAGFTKGVSHVILISGLAGTIASALSMAAGAYLATKSSRELSQTELAHEKREIEENPEEEREELELIYQLKGFTEDEARMLVGRLTERPEQFMKSMASEELGISEMNVASAPKAALSAGLSTAVGAIIPVLPFFWLDGIPAIVTAAIVSMAAHFAVGAAKSLLTIRSWWSSGFEMMWVGALEGVVTFALGVLAGRLL